MRAARREDAGRMGLRVGRWRSGQVRHVDYRPPTGTESRATFRSRPGPGLDMLHAYMDHSQTRLDISDRFQRLDRWPNVGYPSH